jgi:hypothetical protein
MLAIALGRRADDPKVIIRTQTLMGEILVFRTSRASVFRQLGWREFSTEQIKMIQAIVHENVDRIILADK